MTWQILAEAGKSSNVPPTNLSWVKTGQNRLNKQNCVYLVMDFSISVISHACCKTSVNRIWRLSPQSMWMQQTRQKLSWQNSSPDFVTGNCNFDCLCRLDLSYKSFIFGLFLLHFHYLKVLALNMTHNAFSLSVFIYTWNFYGN